MAWFVDSLKDEDFYRHGIQALLERCAKVVANDGQYFEWFIWMSYRFGFVGLIVNKSTSYKNSFIIFI